jgi:hypothetical protein
MTTTIQTVADLRVIAQAQHDKVKGMDFVAAMKEEAGGYNQFRLIYERPRALGEYLYPNGKDQERKALYYEFSWAADQLFRQMMEAHTINPGESTQQDKDDMWRDAWNRGHSNGYNEVWNYYTEVVEMYDKVQNGQIQREEFDDYLDI